MLLNETYTDWISHFVNQHGYLKSIRKSKLRWLFPCACWSLFDTLKHRITQLQRFSTATQLAAQLFGFKFAWCWPTVINNNSNNLYSHNNNNECICKTQNKSRRCRKFLVSASGVGTYLSGTARAVPLLKVGRLVMHFAVPLFGYRLHIALMIDVSFIVT